MFEERDRCAGTDLRLDRGHRCLAPNCSIQPAALDLGRRVAQHEANHHLWMPSGELDGNRALRPDSHQNKTSHAASLGNSGNVKTSLLN